MDVIREADDRK